MLSLCELRRAVGILDQRLSGARLGRIVQIDEFTLILRFDGAGRGGSARSGSNVLISCRSEFARISLINDPPEAPRTPPAFAQYLRSHVGRAFFEGSAILGNDRQAVIRLRSGEGQYQILLSIFGPRSNIYLLGEESRLLFFMRPLEQTRGELEKGQPWAHPSTVLRSAGTDRWAHIPDEAYLDEVERWYENLARRQRLEALSRRLSQALGREAEFLARKSANMEEDLRNAEQAEHHKHLGELLKSVLHTLRKGDESVTVRDYDTGQWVGIPLDPRLSPSQNMEQYFNRYQKELRSIRIIESQLAALRREREEIERLHAECGEIFSGESTDFERAETFAMQPAVRRLLSRRAPAAEKVAVAPKKSDKRRAIPARLMPKRYRSADGLEIWVGRSDEANDYLTTRLAHGRDLFFHLEAAPGSHVVLRTEGRSDPPPESLLDACELAAHFSKLKGARRADVHVAPIKNVRKPPRAKPGLVHVMRGKTVHLRRDPARLERVLASRLD